MASLDHPGIPFNEGELEYLREILPSMESQVAIQLWYQTPGVRSRFLELMGLIERPDHSIWPVSQVAEMLDDKMGYKIPSYQKQYLRGYKEAYESLWSSDEGGWRTAAESKAREICSNILIHRRRDDPPSRVVQS